MNANINKINGSYVTSFWYDRESGTLHVITRNQNHLNEKVFVCSLDKYIEMLETGYKTASVCYNNNADSFVNEMEGNYPCNVVVAKELYPMDYVEPFRSLLDMLNVDFSELYADTCDINNVKFCISGIKVCNENIDVYRLWDTVNTILAHYPKESVLIEFLAMDLILANSKSEPTEADLKHLESYIKNGFANLCIRVYVKEKTDFINQSFLLHNDLTIYSCKVYNYYI